MTGDVSISISDATATEGGSEMKLIDTLVPSQSGGLINARGMNFGPDGHLYISGESNPDDPIQLGFVNRYNAVTGQFMDHFASHPSMTGAKDVEFGPDGNLYVPNNLGDNIYRFNGATGEFMDEFVTSGSGGLDIPRSVIFGPDGNADGNEELYVTSAATDTVMRYDGVTGAFLGAFVSAGSGGLNDPTALVFGPDGNLYVASGAHSDYYNSILRFNGTTGAFMDVFVPSGSGGLTLAPTAGVIFGPDVNNDGNLDLYVSNGEVDAVLIYSGSNGGFLQKFISPALGGLNDPKGLLFDSDGTLIVISNYDSVLRFGQSSQAAFAISLSFDSVEPIIVDYSTASGTAAAGNDYNAASGTLTFTPGETTRMILVQTVNDAIGESRETFTVNLSNAVGGTITDGSATGTIKDDDTTKFYVVNDASSGDRTYEYADGSNGMENYVLGSGNTQPRGAASNVAGDKVWVVDKNKKVFVYNTSGTLQGTGWSAGGLQSSSVAELQGVATNGTDVWLLENTFSSKKNDKVYRYAGAASQTSGSKSVTGNIPLNSANRNPKDIVTDGTYLYVVNDSATDKVFKYTLTGSLVASWTISTSGATNPTGITLDPSNPSHLWIVDSGTDRVYEYSGAVNQANATSKSADASFALAAGNTNPQGIADPPPAAGLGVPQLHSRDSVSLATAAWGASPLTVESPAVITRHRVPHRQHALAALRHVDVVMNGLGTVPDPGYAAVNNPHTLAGSIQRENKPRSDAELDFLGLELDGSIALLAHDLMNIHPGRHVTYR